MNDRWQVLVTANCVDVINPELQKLLEELRFDVVGNRFDEGRKEGVAGEIFLEVRNRSALSKFEITQVNQQAVDGPQVGDGCGKVALVGRAELCDGLDTTSGDRDYTAILLDEPPLHLLEIVLDQGDLGVALSDGGVQVLVEKLVCLGFFGQVPISPRLEPVQELVD